MKINPFSGKQSEGNGKIYVTKPMRRNSRDGASDVVNVCEINTMDSMDDVYFS
jgi:hypothetical protein